MRHAFRRVEHGEVVGPYTFALQLADGTGRRNDVRPVLEGELPRPLQDVTLFNPVELDQTLGTIRWANGADSDPEPLHDWQKDRDDLVAVARRWAASRESSHRAAG